MPIAKLEEIVDQIEPAALLVEPRILRRVVRLDRRLQGQWLLVPRRECYTIERDRLLAFVDHEELDVPLGAELPRRVILLSRPDEPDPTDPAAEANLIHEYLRLLCYGCVHLELENQIARNPNPDAWAAERRAQIGETEFAEIRAVLLKEGYLFQSPSDLDAYVEFVAVYLELRYFAPQELRWYFPAIDDWLAVDRIVSQDIDHRALIERLRASDDKAFIDEEQPDSAAAPRVVRTPSLPPLSISEYRQLQSKAHRAAATGNGIKATLLAFRAWQRAPRGNEAAAQAALRSELSHFVQRLKTALHLSTAESEKWMAALQPLLAPAVDGFWSYEARLLYDLQKVCVEQERGVYRLDLVEWIRTSGKTPVRRPLPLMREALMLRHLSTANRRVSGARIRPDERARLATLMEGVLPRIESRFREHLRQIIGGAFDEVGLQPQNVPEQVARRKLIEEMLDRIVDRGYLTMGDLRDAFSKNDLKLPDVTSFAELARGDQLLRADQMFASELDGVYRRGAIYQRFPQTLSSLVFGTPVGRFLTLYLFIPFGGAYLLIEFFRHINHLFSGHESHPVNLAEQEFEAPPSPPIDWSFIALVVALGTWMLLLMHRPDFRAWSLAKLHEGWRLARVVLIDLPSRALKSEYVQRFLHSRTFAIVRTYLIWPGLLTYALRLLASAAGYRWTDQLVLNVFLIIALLLNSPLGRLVAELTTDGLMRAWHNLGMRVIAAVFQWIIDLFQGLAATLERMVYTVDEWLRFRAGDSRSLQAVKLAGGVVWFFVSYLVVFVFTLLVEPQINPIKHFPVVTVSHKLILPTGPALVTQLSPYLGKAEATTLVVTTILLIPGVFGYLVWELKENWRLYAANRSRHLRPEPIGRHGETMMRLFRPGFHSGTLPKLYTALRRATRRTDRRSEARIHHRRNAIDHVAEDVGRFVERELVYLLEQIHFLPPHSIMVGAVHAATNRLDVEILLREEPKLPAVLTWEYQAGELRGEVVQLGWIESLSPHQQRTITTALTGLFQRTDVAQVESSLPIEITPPFTWQSWVTAWSQRGR